MLLKEVSLRLRLSPGLTAVPAHSRSQGPQGADTRLPGGALEAGVGGAGAGQGRLALFGFPSAGGHRPCGPFLGLPVPPLC